MGNYYTLSERWSDETPVFAQLSERTPPLIRILRLLSGTVVLEPTWNSHLTFVQTNYLNGSHVECQRDLLSFLDIVFEDGSPDIDDFSNISKKLSKTDRAFYSGILSDLILLLAAIEQDKNTESFLLLYRLLERVSVALPLIYSSREKSFRDASKFLVSLADDGSSSDLNVLNRFLVQHADRNESFNGLHYDFDVTAPQEEMVREIISQINSCLAGVVSGMSVDKERAKIKVPYKSMSQFIANLRHRCFHDQTARTNLDLAKVGGSEVLLACFVKGFLIWFSYIFVDVARWEIERLSV